MLKNIFQTREGKLRDQVESYFSEGIENLSKKLFNGAMIAFDKAMKLDPENVYPRLLTELNKFSAAGETEAALAVGLNLLKQKNDDYELANKLGNFARELKDYKQANGLYKTALKINRNYRIAYYNMAASLAKVDIYDESVMTALSQFDSQRDYKLPDYAGNPKLIDDITKTIREKKKNYVQEKEQELKLDKELKERANDLVAARQIDLEIKVLKSLAEKVNPDDIIAELKNEIEDNPDEAKEYQYNLVIFALENNETALALELIKEIPTDAFEHVEMLKAIALAQLGRLAKAIDILVRLLGKNEYNRYYNLNLGLMLKKKGKQFLATKYLIKTAVLLAKSKGLYSMKALLEIANQEYEKGRNIKALKYFRIAVTEIKDPEIWFNIGTIYLELKRHDEAAFAFRSSLKLDSGSVLAKKRLREIHDYYSERGDTLVAERKLKPGVEKYLKAFRISRVPETAKKAADIFKQLNELKKEQELRTVWKRLVAAEKAREEEEMRQMLISKGKKLLRENQPSKAAGSFEAAFLMKVDRNIFLQLATLYKQMNKKDMLESLEERWEKMLEAEDKMKKDNKDIKRTAKSDAIGG